MRWKWVRNFELKLFHQFFWSTNIRFQRMFLNSCVCVYFSFSDSIHVRINTTNKRSNTCSLLFGICSESCVWMDGCFFILEISSRLYLTVYEYVYLLSRILWNSSIKSDSQTKTKIYSHRFQTTQDYSMSSDSVFGHL